MHRAQRGIGVSMAVASLIALWGCGGGPSATSSRTEAQVTGTVKIRGKPMKTGEITFNPTNSARADVTPRTAPIKPDGTYEASTLVGRNLVKITGPQILKEPELG